MKYQLNQIGNIITGHTPSTKRKEYWDSNDFMFVCPPDLRSQRYIKQTEKYVSSRGCQSCKTILVNKNSVFVSCRATIGLIGIATCECITNQDINTITNIDNRIINPLYLFYWFLSKKDFLNLISYNGATLQNIKKTAFEKINVDAPPLDVQQHIVDTI